ncbi:MAG: CHAP domain-containing protein [Eubacteriales bacterium]
MNDAVIINMLSGITFDGMIEDEVLRSYTLINSNIIAVENSYNLEYYDFYEYYGVVYATETIKYTKFDSNYTDVISHQITFTYDNSCVIIASSNYRESFISFDSCAYVPATTTNSAYTINSNTDNESSGITLTCSQANNLVQIALQEEGYIEKRICEQLNDKYALPRTSTYDNHTKYGQWHSSCAAWCVMFVAWCANQAGISTDIIPKTQWGNVSNFNTLLKENGGTYHPVKDSTGTYYIPQSGDIFFMKTSEGNHTGIVVSTEITSNNTTLVWVIDGNWNDQVSYRSHNLSDPLFTGYITPAYIEPSQITDNTKHDYVCSDHSTSLLHTCSYCGKEATSSLSGDHINTMEHNCSLCSETVTATWLGNHPTTVNHTCSLCGHIEEGNLGTTGYAHNASSHWLTCTVCNATWNNGAHIWIPINNGNEGYKCRTCGRHTFAITINKLLPLIQSKE